MPRRSKWFKYNRDTEQVEQITQPDRVVTKAAWPIYSDRAGVNPHQISEAEATMRGLGVNTKYEKQTGRAIFRNAKHRKEHCEAVGIYDRNGGYSDPQPK
jgi:hypothetical protein